MNNELGDSRQENLAPIFSLVCISSSQGYHYTLCLEFPTLPVHLGKAGDWVMPSEPQDRFTPNHRDHPKTNTSEFSFKEVFSQPQALESIAKCFREVKRKLSGEKDNKQRT